MTVFLVKQIGKPEIVIFSAFLLLILGKVITLDEDLRGFSNKEMLTVAFLFVVSTSLQISGTLDMVISKFLIPLFYTAILGGTCTLIGTPIDNGNCNCFKDYSYGSCYCPYGYFNDNIWNNQS